VLFDGSKLIAETGQIDSEGNCSKKFLKNFGDTPVSRVSQRIPAPEIDVKSPGVIHGVASKSNRKEYQQ
jgi:hypothetical protein